MVSTCLQQLNALVSSGSPPGSIFIHAPATSTNAVADSIVSILRAHLARPSESDRQPTVSELLPKIARVDLEDIHSTKQFFDQVLNQFVAWEQTWSEAEMGVGNWEDAREFAGLKVVESRNETDEGRMRKRRKMSHRTTGSDSEDDLTSGSGDRTNWKLKWDLSTPPPAPETTLAPIRNTVEAFHHSLTLIYHLSTSDAEIATDDFDFQPGMALSMHPDPEKARQRRYIVIEHGELLADLAAGSGGGGALSGAAKETGMGMTFSSTIHRLSQLAELPFTVITVSRLPYHKSRETLVGLAAPCVLEYLEPPLDASLSLLASRFTSSRLFEHPRPDSRLSRQDLSNLFSTFLSLLSMSMQSSIGNDLDQLTWWACKLWPQCVEVVEGSNPPIPPNQMDRLKVAFQPYLNAAISQWGQPRTSLAHQPRTCLDPNSQPRSNHSGSSVQHGFSGSIREVPKAPVYLEPVDQSPLKSMKVSSHSNEYEPVPLRPLGGTPASSSLLVSSTSHDKSVATSSLTKSLPTVSRFLLIAAFLAAHNPPKSDVRMFVKVDELEGIARKGKKGKRGATKIQAGVSSSKKKGNLAAFMSGGKPFAYERLIAIFESIVDERREFSVGSIAVHQSVQTLISLRLLLKASGEKTDKGVLDGIRLKCPLSRDEVNAMGKGVGWPEWKERLIDIDD
ncbi:uncharacterized protein JCM15063_000499 [Sporobolomyces koalae]|uniref:uncharacterized protein n=1 Tax=Sporobolomyces koalae TaxID=500713 RepID=UPI00316E92CB